MERIRRRRPLASRDNRGRIQGPEIAVAAKSDALARAEGSSPSGKSPTHLGMRERVAEETSTQLDRRPAPEMTILAIRRRRPPEFRARKT